MTLSISTVGNRRGRLFTDLNNNLLKHQMQVIETDKTRLRLVTNEDTASVEQDIPKEPVLREPVAPVFIKEVKTKETAIKENKTTNKQTKKEIELLTYEQVDHEDGPLYFHVWADDGSLAITRDNVCLRDLEDYMVMIMKFPYSAKGSYFPTATSFIDSGFNDMEFIETYGRLQELDLD